MRGIIARWLALVVLVAAPTLIRYEITSQATFACTRDGKFAGTCHAEPTLRQLVVHERNDWDWSGTDYAPRVWFMPTMPIDDIGMAIPSGGAHYIKLLPSKECDTRMIMGWATAAPCLFEGTFGYEIPLDETDYTASDERTLAVRFNTFLRDPSRRSFRLRQPGAFHPGYMLFYLAAGLVAFLIVRRLLALRTAAWVAAVEQIPATPITAYRG